MTADLVAVQRAVADALRRGCKAYNGKKPIIKVIAHEFDPRRVSRRTHSSAACFRADASAIACIPGIGSLHLSSKVLPRNALTSDAV